MVEGIRRGDLVGIAVAGERGAFAAPEHSGGAAIPHPWARHVQRVDAELPRWAMWSSDTARALVAAGVEVRSSWDLRAVDRLLHGRWRTDPARIWANAYELAYEGIPIDVPADLFHPYLAPNAAEGPVDASGYLRAHWVARDWCATDAHAVQWAEAITAVARIQMEQVMTLKHSERVLATARCESTTELLCAELECVGLPIDRREAERIITSHAGPRPRDSDDEIAARSARDAEVFTHVPELPPIDLRSPGQVRTLLRYVGIEVPDTRAGTLRRLREAHPVVEALLAWRKSERIATTYGYEWLDESVGGDGRLRGSWSSSDGAAGRMTASAGLHNLVAEMRAAVVAEPGFTFVRADLGQIEPRVLAVISGDVALAHATQQDDLYAPIAAQLGVDRATAKLAVLGAMYGQTTGHGAAALARMRNAYPVAMAYLDAGDRAGRVGEDLRTYGGRLVRLASTNPDTIDERDARSIAAARGRYGRNALVQGAAAEFFKLWAVTVRARAVALDARIVLCLHDELVLHVAIGDAPAAVRLVDDALRETAFRFAPDNTVRFVADTSIVSRWSDV